jgi:pimeloyl-ACP methyl ester carboxylesterase
MYDGEQRYTEVHVPVLAIYAGRNDLPADADSATSAAWIAKSVPASQVLKRNVPGARIVVLPGATHAVFDSNQGDVLREMHAFIESLPVARSSRP